MRLIDADALKKKILTTTFTKNNMWAINLLIGLIDDTPTDDAWISVKDRLPDVGETVLFTGINSYGNRVRTQQGYFNSGVWMWISDGNGGLANDTITHWMPLPEPPKEAT